MYIEEKNDTVPIQNKRSIKHAHARTQNNV